MEFLNLWDSSNLPSLDNLGWLGEHDLPPGKLTCPLKITGWKMYFLLKMGNFPCHVSFHGCTSSMQNTNLHLHDKIDHLCIWRSVDSVGGSGLPTNIAPFITCRGPPCRTPVTMRSINVWLVSGKVPNMLLTGIYKWSICSPFLRNKGDHNVDESSCTQISRIFKFYPKHHQELQVPKIWRYWTVFCWLNWWRVFPHIRRIPTAYIGEI